MSRFAPELACTACGGRQGADPPGFRCACGGLYEVVPRDAKLPPPAALAARRASPDPLDRSGVWRFREVLPDLPRPAIVTRGEGGTGLYRSEVLGRWCGLAGVLDLKHEGENPTGSFKDRGMTVAVSVARALGRRAVACASTGNTSASMASYAALGGLKAFVFLPAGKAAGGKLAQTLAYGARTLEIEGSFDDAMARVEEVCRDRAVYLVNSINPFRIEGQKTIVLELLEDLGWDPPDWIVLPGGNLGNTAAFGRALEEALALGLIPRLPRLAVVQAQGASPFHRMFASGARELVPLAPETLATAIRIGNPVSWRKARRAVEATGGLVEAVSDAEILAAKAAVDAAGIGAEPASCAAVAGLRKLVAAGKVAPGARVAAVLTGHLLKDPETTTAYHAPGRGAGANPPRRVANDPEAIGRTLDEELAG